MVDDTATVLRNVEGLFQAGTTCGLTDGQLLERFASSRGADDEAAQAAFAALVDRHAGMAIRTFRRVLGAGQAEEDAAPATFLVLARQPRSILSKESVAAWLHGVAVRIASKERRAAVRRKRREERGKELALARRMDHASRDHDPERWTELHEELMVL